MTDDGITLNGKPIPLEIGRSYMIQEVYDLALEEGILSSDAGYGSWLWLERMDPVTGANEDICLGSEGGHKHYWEPMADDACYTSEHDERLGHRLTRKERRDVEPEVDTSTRDLLENHKPYKPLTSEEKKELDAAVADDPSVAENLDAFEMRNRLGRHAKVLARESMVLDLVLSTGSTLTYMHQVPEDGGDPSIWDVSVNSRVFRDRKTMPKRILVTIAVEGED